MASSIENQLKTILSRNADYPTIQRIKDGQLSDAANSVLQARRKSLMWQSGIFYSMLMIPMLANLILTISNSLHQSHHTLAGFELFPFLALGMLAMIVEAKTSITQLETVLTLWHLEDTERQGEAMETIAEVLGQ